jgi:hypothetical protein
MRTTMRRQRTTLTIGLASWAIAVVLLFAALPRMAGVQAPLTTPTPTPAPIPSYATV